MDEGLAGHSARGFLGTRMPRVCVLMCQRCVYGVAVCVLARREDFHVLTKNIGVAIYQLKLGRITYFSAVTLL